MTTKQIMEKIWITFVSGREVQDNYKLMLYALIEIGLDWESGIMTYPKLHRQLHPNAKDLEWLSGILKQVTGMTWEELTDDNNK
jgi:hypothetical protein